MCSGVIDLFVRPWWKESLNNNGQEKFEETKGVMRIRKSKKKDKQRSTKHTHIKLKIEEHEPHWKPGVNSLPLISTKQNITSRLHSLTQNEKKPYMTYYFGNQDLELWRVQIWNGFKLVDEIRTMSFDNWIAKSNACINRRKLHVQICFNTKRPHTITN